MRSRQHRETPAREVRRRSRFARAWPVPLALLLCVASPGRAQEAGPAAPSVTLADGAWAQLAVPGDASDLTVAELFGSALDAGAYASDWIVYAYDPGAAGYVDPGASGSLAQGQGFWVIQVTGADVVLELPASVPPATGTQGPSCPSSGGCAELALATGDAGPSLQMWGPPLPGPTPVDDIGFTTDAAGSPCRTGCDVLAASDAGLVHPNLWRYDPGTGTYVDRALADAVQAWEGLWIETRRRTDGARVAVRVALPPPDVDATGADVLLVVGGLPLGVDDAALRDELEGLGHAVEAVDDGTVAAAGADRKDLVLVAASVDPDAVGNRFNQSAAPLVVLASGLYDRLGLTRAIDVAGQAPDHGVANGRTRLEVFGPHPLAAGLSGTLPVVDAAAGFAWGVPGTSAAVAATLDGDAARAAVFGYEAGDRLADSSAAPARRVGLFPGPGAAGRWNANARALFAAAVGWALDGAPAVDVVRILPLGDSITNGYAGYWSYRRNLAALLDIDGCRYTMTGTRFGPAAGRPGAGAFDRDHEGRSGLRSDEVLAGLPGWLPGNEPDWVLLHLGTNDVLQAGRTVEAARDNIDAIIDLLRARVPDVGILLAQIIPNRPRNEAEVVRLNDYLATLGAAKDLPGSPVIVVDQYSGFDISVHAPDQVHPNARGETLMADRWYQALRPRIDAACGG